MGRVLIKSYCTPRTCNQGPYTTIPDQYDMHYSYDLAGNWTFAGRGYLSGRNGANPGVGYYYGGLSMSNSGSSQPLGATSDVPIDATHPHQDVVASMTYSPLGGVTNVTLGEEYAQSFKYSPRGWGLQLTTVDANGNVSVYDTASRDQDGNILQVSDTVLGQYAYCYDTLNRLVKASGGATCTSNANGTIYGYDAFGNQASRQAQGGSTYQFEFVPNAHNQNPAATYDAAGNLLNDGVHSYTYDAEGRITTVDGATHYEYDAEGERVAEGPVGQAPTTDFLYDLNGKLVTVVGANFKMLRTSLYVAGMHWAE